ncbi:MAG: ATP-binding protein [Hyphomonadaceae bacterium]
MFEVGAPITPMVGNRRWRQFRSYVLAAGIVALATCAGHAWSLLPDARNLSLVFFGAILIAGAWLGARPALFAAVLAFLAYNFFLIEPRLSLRFAAADVLAFVTFLVGALLVGALSGRLSDRAREATSRLRDVSVLFDASRDLARALHPEEAAGRLVAQIERGGAEAAVWLGAPPRHRLASHSPARAHEASMLALQVARVLAGEGAQAGGAAAVYRLAIGERVLGAVALWTPTGEAPAPGWIDAMLELGAVAIDRARLIKEVAEASLVAEKEGLRTSLLSSLSHDLRTPIATIVASATALEEHDAKFDSATRLEMLHTIQQEGDRLNRYVSNLLEMTRLESGALQINKVVMAPGEAMASALERVSARLKDRRVLRMFDSDARQICVDPVLIEQALINVLENAAAYSPAGSTILVSVKADRARVLMSIEDEGAGIPAADLDRVFERFFRGRSDRRGAGVGLGLSVARGLIEAFGGEIKAVSPAAGGKGARVEIRLPAYASLETAV